MIGKIYMIFLYPGNPVIRSNIYCLEKAQETLINYFAFFAPFGGSIFNKFGRDNQIYRIFLLLLGDLGILSGDKSFIIRIILLVST